MFRILFLLCLVFLVSIPSNSFAQDDMMTPPKPLENKVYDAMVGEWTGESDMMGMKMDEQLKIYWNLNHQFIMMDLTSTAKDGSGFKYSGLGIFGVDKKGNAKTWWFDDWGAESMMAGSGTFGDMKLTSSSSNEMFKDNRTFEWKDGNMVMTWNASFTQAGKETKMDGQTVFKKK